MYYDSRRAEYVGFTRGDTWTLRTLNRTVARTASPSFDGPFPPAEVVHSGSSLQDQLYAQVAIARLETLTDRQCIRSYSPFTLHLSLLTAHRSPLTAHPPPIGTTSPPSSPLTSSISSSLPSGQFTGPRCSASPHRTSSSSQLTLHCAPTSPARPYPRPSARTLGRHPVPSSLRAAAAHRKVQGAGCREIAWRRRWRRRPP